MTRWVRSCAGTAKPKRTPEPSERRRNDGKIAHPPAALPAGAGLWGGGPARRRHQWPVEPRALALGRWRRSGAPTAGGGAGRGLFCGGMALGHRRAGGPEAAGPAGNSGTVGHCGHHPDRLPGAGQGAVCQPVFRPAAAGQRGAVPVVCVFAHDHRLRPHCQQPVRHADFEGRGPALVTELAERQHFCQAGGASGPDRGGGVHRRLGRALGDRPPAGGPAVRQRELSGHCPGADGHSVAGSAAPLQAVAPAALRGGAGVYSAGAGLPKRRADRPGVCRAAGAGPLFAAAVCGKAGAGAAVPGGPAGGGLYLGFEPCVR